MSSLSRGLLPLALCVLTQAPGCSRPKPYVWPNGQLAGYVKDSREPAEAKLAAGDVTGAMWSWHHALGRFSQAVESRDPTLPVWADFTKAWPSLAAALDRKIAEARSAGNVHLAIDLVDTVVYIDRRTEGYMSIPLMTTQFPQTATWRAKHHQQIRKARDLAAEARAAAAAHQHALALCLTAAGGDAKATAQASQLFAATLGNKRIKLVIEHDPTKVMDALAPVIGSVYTLDDQADTVVRVKVDVGYKESTETIEGAVENATGEVEEVYSDAARAHPAELQRYIDAKARHARWSGRSCPAECLEDIRSEGRAQVALRDTLRGGATITVTRDVTTSTAVQVEVNTHRATVEFTATIEAPREVPARVHQRFTATAIARDRKPSRAEVGPKLNAAFEGQVMGSLKLRTGSAAKDLLKLVSLPAGPARVDGELATFFTALAKGEGLTDAKLEVIREVCGLDATRASGALAVRNLMGIKVATP